MKKNYIILLFAILFAGAFTKAQTALGPGDLVVISLEADAPDTFRFVPLVDLLPMTEIKFTDNGWESSTGMFRANEGIITYVVPAGTTIAAGTNIAVDLTNLPPEFTNTSVNFSASGDQVLVYQGPDATPTFLFAVQSNSSEWQADATASTNSALPPGLTNDVNAAAAGAGTGAGDEFDNIYYVGITTGSRDALSAAVGDSANWVGDDSKDPNSEITTNFTIQAATTNPSISITSPPDNTTIPATTSVDVQFSTANFNYNTDGDLSFTVATGGTAVSSVKPDDTFETISVTPGETYTLTAQLRDTNGNALTNSESSSMVTFTVDFPCDLNLDLGSITTTCDNSTAGVDTYSATIDFNGGNTGVTYNFTVPTGVVVTGDNPDNVAMGTIQLSNMQEGTDTDIMLTGNSGSSCDLTATFFSPTCLSLPITEQFDYTVGDFLVDQTNWSPDNTGDEILVSNGNLTVSGLAPSQGNHVTFSEDGQEAILNFTPASSGVVYAGFAFQVSAFQTGNNPDTTDGGYFAIFSDGGGGFQSRLWVRPIEDPATMMLGSTYEIGYGEESSNPQFASGTYNLGDTVFVVMAYDIDNSEARLYINPAQSTFGSTAPATADIVSDDSANPASSIGSFQLRQDSDRETPFMLVDELRIATSYAEVTPTSAASIDSSSIAGFTMYPNPVSNGLLNVKTLSATSKNIEIYNVLGKRVLSSAFNGTREQLNVSALNSGIYILKITEGSNSESRKLIIK